MQLWFKNIFILFCTSFLISDFAIAQITAAKPDSTKIYKNIETYSRQSKLKTFVYRLIFKPVTPDKKNKEVRKKAYKKLIQKPYSAFEGKIIRKIDIVTLDPFGYSATDTTFAIQNFLLNAGNGMHIKTRRITIQNLLLIHKNDSFNSLLVKESERLIRSQKYVHEVYFYVVAAGAKSDSVDIFIRELDKWSIIPKGSISTSVISVEITDKNFLGSGHEFQNVFSRNITNGINSFNTNYFIPNVRNTYINTKLHYGVDGYGNFTRSLAVDRPFYSPLAKWAAGVSVASQFREDSLKDINLAFVPFHLRFNTQDFWAGKAVQIFKETREEELVTNLIFTVRYLRIRYSERTSEQNDPLHIYSNEDFYLGGIGISARKYVQDKYIFKYGVIEDVPVGKIFGVTGGYQLKNNSRRLYLGMRFSFGNYYEWGYLSSTIEYGTFFHLSHAEQGAFTAGVNYSTGLFEIGKWKFRQFVKPQITIGINRFSYDSLTLNDGYGLDGFNSPALSGTRRLLFTMQTQSYSPWNFIGFRFGPFLTCSLGMIGDDVNGLKNSKVYSQIGLGVLIKNENLVFNSFQISISFYPLIPGIGQDVFKMNSFKTTDFGFRDFEIEKPSRIIFQ
ncbi:MAG: hypothetical protein QG611_537 [Bacteroidota bacterium]|nr:hypothetical protein [Bacteroidota bacterium]